MFTRKLQQQLAKKLQLATWTDWNAHDYLETYFAELGPDSVETLTFLVRTLNKFPNNVDLEVLDFGSGPTVFAGLAAAPYAKAIHVCDYLYDNLREIKKWIDLSPDHFNWDSSIRLILELENKKINNKSIEQRANTLRNRITKLMKCDASSSRPLGIHTKQYSLVLSNFCADSATSSKSTWRHYMKNISNLVSDNGYICIAALRNCKAYKNGEQFFPSANINESDLEEVLLKEDFDPSSMVIEVKYVPDCAQDGFTSVMFASAKKLITKQIVKEQLKYIAQSRP